MKLNRTIYLGAMLFALSTSSCVKQKITTPELAEFVAAPQGNAGAYYVTSDPNSTFKVPVGFTTSSGKDRVINFTVTSSTATAGTQYTVGSSITIPAGKVVDSIPVKGIFAGYPIGRIDTLLFTITGGDGSVYPGTASKYTLIVQGYCDVVAANLIGNYTNTVDTYHGAPSAQGPYTVNISNWTSISPTSATIVIQQLGATSDVGFGDVYSNAPGFLPGDQASIGLTASLDWSNPANFSIKIAKQAYVLNSYGNGPSTIAATGTFSSCAETFTIKFNVTDPSAAYGAVVTTLMR